MNLASTVAKYVNEHIASIDILQKLIPEYSHGPIEISHVLKVDREVIYLTGRYLKLQRGIA